MANKSSWRKKYKTLKEYYEKEFDPQYFSFSDDELHIDPDEVRRIDSYSNYDLEQQQKEYIKCYNDFIYFCHKYIRIAHPKHGIVPFILYRYQKRVIEEYEDHRFNIIAKFRQGGLTTLTVLWGLWRCMFRRNETIMLFSKTDREAKVAGEIVARAISYLPEWLKPEMETNSKHEKVFATTESGFFFYTPNAARSRSITYLIIDEAAFIKGMDEHWKGMYPVVSTGGNVIVISTVHGVGNWYEETFHGAQDGSNPFHVIELDYTEHPDYNDPEWVRKTKAILGEKGWAQEVMRQFLGANDTFIKSNILIELAQYTKSIEPARKLFPEWNNQDEIREQMLIEAEKGGDFEEWDKGSLWIFNEPKPGKEYIIGADIAEGLGEAGDNSSFQVIDAISMVQVAEFYSNNIQTYELAHLIAMVGNTYNKATIVVENMGPGKAVLDTLENVLRYENIYHQDLKTPGVRVGSNRAYILDSLHNAIAGRRIIINSKRLVKELKTFIYDPRSKKAIHMTGKHDDAIFALAHALHVRSEVFRNTPYGAETIVHPDNPLTSSTYQKIKEELSKGAPEDWLDWEKELIDTVPEDIYYSEFAAEFRRRNEAILKEFAM